jgi:DNA mismatch repair protein MutS
MPIDRKLTPMQEQYFNIKSKYKDAVVLFRLGDFYEGFDEDAKTMSKVLGLTLTSRDKKNNMPMAGMPHHALKNYLHKLVDAGYKVVIVDQIEDPRLAKGIVKREVTRVITPGTLIEDDEKDSRYIAALFSDKNKIGFALCDLGTGELRVTEFPESLAGRKKLSDEVRKVAPRQLVVANSADFEFSDIYLEKLEDYYFSVKEATAKILDLFGVKSLDGFGLGKHTSGISAIGALLEYLNETQKTDLKHIVKVTPYEVSERMVIDPSTIRNLELFYSTRGTEDASLYSTINKTNTGMGGRLLKTLILNPFINKALIEQRLNSVEVLFKDQAILEKLRANLEEVYDVQRLAGKIGLGSINPKDFHALKTSLVRVKELVAGLDDLKDALLQSYAKKTKEIYVSLDSLIENIEATLDENAPALITDGGIIKTGVNAEIDELRDAMVNGKDWIKNLEIDEKARTGIPSLKVKFNRVFGYYIEISKANLDKVPEDYIRKQTLVNAERFITPEMKEVERKVLGAEEKLIDLETEIFNDFKEKSKEYLQPLQEISEIVANLDVLANFAYIAIYNNYVKPVIYTSQEKDGCISIKGARHPVVEAIEGQANYIPNDISIDNKTEQLVVLTGPNMAGKSTYIRQVALLSLMAQMGSFVPAASAEISLVDRIFTRVGASDNLSGGQSTFMVEMTEAANIANNATENSLIILDEVGRGTSTYDGLSIAWSLAEYLHDKVGAKTLFATHYHELTQLETQFDRIVNYNVEVKEKGDEVLFLRTVAKGGTDRSYGIYVAKISGMPESIILRAKEILDHLETSNGSGKSKIKEPQAKTIIQQAMFMGGENDKIVEEFKALDLDNMSPKEALEKLYEIKKKLE